MKHNLSASWTHLPLINLEFYDVREMKWVPFELDELVKGFYYKVSSPQHKHPGFFYVEDVYYNAIKRRWDATITPVASSLEVTVAAINLNNLK